MADTLETTPQVQVSADFDIGDTDKLPESKQRGPDGRFAKPAETPAESKPSVEPQAPVDHHRVYLEHEAATLGFTPEQIAEFTTGALGATLARIARIQADRPAASQPVTPPVAPVAAPSEPEEDDLSEEQFDPVLVKAIKSLRAEKKAHTEKLKALEEANRTLSQRELDRTISSTAERIDAAFEALGPAYEKVLGKGSAQEFTEAQQGQLRRRVAILTEAGIDMRNPPPPLKLKAMIQQAAKTLYPVSASDKPSNAYEEAAKKEAAKPGERITPEQWEEAGLASATARHEGEPPKGRTRAIQKLAEKMHENGIIPKPPPPSDELDGFFK